MQESPQAVVRVIERRLQTRASEAEAMDRCLCFELGDDETRLVLELRPPARIIDASSAQQPGHSPPSSAPDCTFLLSASDFVELFAGRATSRALFQQGRLRIRGDLNHVLELPRVVEMLS